ncbi:unnamed protein product, partial [Arabidopsis halleri]
NSRFLFEFLRLLPLVSLSLSLRFSLTLFLVTSFSHTSLITSRVSYSKPSF